MRARNGASEGKRRQPSGTVLEAVKAQSLVSFVWFLGVIVALDPTLDGSSILRLEARGDHMARLMIIVPPRGQ
jgi:hypothetical protein